VLAYPGCPGNEAVKQVFVVTAKVNNNRHLIGATEWARHDGERHQVNIIYLFYDI